MILYDFDYATIYRQMCEEKVHIDYWIHKSAKQVWKEFKNSKTVPVWKYELRTMTKTNNTYLIWYYAMTRAECEHQTCFAGATLLLNDNNGRRLAIALKTFRDLSDKNTTVDSLQIFSSHFFSRYKERYTFMKDLDSLELMTAFFGRNGGYLMEVDYEKFTLEKDRKQNGSAWGIDDGVTFAIKEWVDITDTKKIFMARHNTFLSRNELKPDQNAVLPNQDAMRSKLMHHFKK